MVLDPVMPEFVHGWIAVGLIAGVVGGVCGYLGIRVALLRNVAQPIEQDPEAEIELVGLVGAHPEQWLRLYGVLESGHFAVLKARLQYEEIEGIIKGSWLGEMAYDGDNDDELELIVAQAAKDDRYISLVEDTRRVSDPGGTSTKTYKELRESALKLGEVVAGNGKGRELSSERSPFILDEGDSLLYRGASVRSEKRELVGAAAGAVAGMVGWWSLSKLPLGTIGLALGIIVIVGLVFSSVVIASVDFDTFYLDNMVFYSTGVAIWAALVGLAVVSHHPMWLLAGGLSAVVVAGTFEIMSRVYGATAGITQGMGDTAIVLVSVGVPAGLTHSWYVGLYSVLAGCVLMIIGWTVLRVKNKVTRMTPVAFGPYLASGWVVALAWWALTQR